MMFAETDGDTMNWPQFASHTITAMVTAVFFGLVYLLPVLSRYLGQRQMDTAKAKAMVDEAAIGARALQARNDLASRSAMADFERNAFNETIALLRAECKQSREDASRHAASERACLEKYARASRALRVMYDTMALHGLTKGMLPIDTILGKPDDLELSLFENNAAQRSAMVEEKVANLPERPPCGS